MPALRADHPAPQSRTVPEAATSGGDWRNLLEPCSLVAAFLEHPPEDFSAHPIALADGSLLPAFVTRYDLTTTLDAGPRKLLQRTPLLRSLARRLRPRTLFAGTTVSEYLPIPGRPAAADLVARCLDARRELAASFLILKDLPWDSPLLSEEENRTAADLVTSCRRRGFLVVSGQALAYVPIDFGSEEEYLGRLSRPRRKDLRRKLRSRSELRVDALATGSAALADEAFLSHLFGLYLQVHDQSSVHFDRLTPPFFRAVLQKKGGILFTYRRDDLLVGYNLCFVERGNLVDKYVGFAYPDARECNLYFVSWFENLAFARTHGLRAYVAGWTDPEVKRSLGARFTLTRHAVHVRNPVLRSVLRPLRGFFEGDRAWGERSAASP